MSQQEIAAGNSGRITPLTNNSFTGWTLCVRIFLAFLLAIVLPLGASTWYSTSTLETRLRQRITADLDTLADDAAQRLSNQLATQIGDAADLARLPLVTDALMRVENATASHGAERNIGLRDTDFAAFSGFMQRRGYDDFLLISVRGEVLFCLGGLLPMGSDLRGEALRQTPLAITFEQAQNSAKAAFSAIGRNPKTQRYDYYMVMPVQVADTVLGAFALRLTPKAVFELSRRIQHMGHSSEAVIGMRGRDDSIALSAFRDATMVTAGNYSDPAVAEPMQRALSGEPGMGMGHDYRGTEVLAAWRFLPGARWGLVVKSEAREFFAELSALRRRNVTLQAASILVAALVSWLLARSIAAPVQRLARAAADVGQGHWPAPLQARDGGGEIASLTKHFNAMVADLRTQTERTQEHFLELQRSQDYLRTVIDSSGEGIITIDQKGLIQSINQKTEQLFGYTSLDLLGKNISLLLPEAERAAHDRYLRNSDLHAPRIINRSRDLFGRHRDGSEIPIELTVSRMQWQGRSLFVGVVSDISERIAATRALQASEKKYQGLFHHSPGAYAGVDSQGRISRHNPAYAELLGYSGESLVGRHVFSLHPDTPDSRQTATEILNEVLQCHEVKRAETELLHRDGHTIVVEISTRPLRDEHGQLRESLATLVDITQRKTLEKELRMAQLAAEKASQAKSAFLSSTSHELRTPLNAILGFSKMLESDRKAPLDASQARRVRHIIDGGKHLLELINGVLDLAKIESGATQAILEAVEVNPMLAQCKTFMAPLARQNKVKLAHQCSCPPGCRERVTADPIMLKQVLLNLIGNAVKYNRPGGTVEVACAALDSGWVHISVTDTGPGIAENLLDDLFLPFNRLNAANGEIEGAGIGLTVCKHLVQAMDGRIGVSSEVGKGSEFWFELPAARAGGVEQSAPVQATRGPLHRQTPRSGHVGETPNQHLVFESGRVLLADDNPLNQELCQSFLQQHGLLVDIAENGLDALTALENTSYDLVLMDVHMPKLDGLTTVRRIRATTPKDALPVIGISADAFPDDIDSALQAGMNDYLAKPIDVFELLALVGQYLPHHHADPDGD